MVFPRKVIFWKKNHNTADRMKKSKLKWESYSLKENHTSILDTSEICNRMNDK